MKRLPLLLMAVVGLAVLPSTPVRGEDSVRLSRTNALIGEHLVMEIRVTAPPKATVELTPGTPSWAGVELVGIDDVTQVPGADGVVWYIAARIAPFAPGTVSFAPSVAIVEGSEAVTVELPPVQLTAVATLPADAELALSPLPPPVAIAGAESPLFKPVLVAGGLFGSALLSLAIWLLLRVAGRRVRRHVPLVAVPEAPASLEGAEQVLDTDPVAAYRLMSSVVKSELARRYGLRATALTSSELRRRLEAEGDRWQARLVGGLLEECDSVIYAGYRPAAERRQADLTMAREIVEVAG